MVAGNNLDIDAHLRLALLAAAALAAAVPASTGAAPAPVPDLVLSRVELVGLPEPKPYLLVDDTGLPQRFSVRLVTTNAGKAAAGPSSTRLVIADTTTQKKLVDVRLEVPALASGKSHPSVVPAAVASKIRPHLAFVLVHAQADFANAVPEGKPAEKNNQFVGGAIPVVAYRWNAVRWSVDAALPGLEHRTELDPGSKFFFRFEGYSAALQQFQYEAVGGIQDTETYPTCAPNIAKAQHDPWPDGSLTIKASLTSYQGKLESSKEPPYSFTCSSAPLPFNGQLFQNMDTFVGLKGLPTMKPSAVRLSGAGNAPNAILDWDFEAEVPSQ